MYDFFVDLEARFRERWEGGDMRAAATIVIEGYGPEVFGFLVGYMRDHTAAADVFAQASEDLWTSLARFEGRASARTFFYAIARHGAARFRRSPEARASHRVGLSEAGEIAVRVRTETLAHLKTENKDALQKIRDALDPEDQALLVLRIDRAMAWNDIARVLDDTGEDLDDDALTRASARLRKRFEVVKEEIRAQAKRAGLVG